MPFKSQQMFMGENQMSFDQNEEFPFKSKRKDVDNIETLYKRVKICKSCYIVYSLAARHFDNLLQKHLQGIFIFFKHHNNFIR